MALIAKDPLIGAILTIGITITEDDPVNALPGVRASVLQ
jgi:hypothetical protein